MKRASISPGNGVFWQFHHRIEDGQRTYPLTHPECESKPHRATGIVHDEMKLIKPERVDRSRRPCTDTRERVVKLGRPLGQAQSRPVEAEGPEPACGQLRDDLPVEEARGREAVHEDDGFSVTLLEDKAADTGGTKVGPGRAVPFKNCGGRLIHIYTHRSPSRMLGSPASAEAGLLSSQTNPGPRLRHNLLLEGWGWWQTTLSRPPQAAPQNPQGTCPTGRHQWSSSGLEAQKDPCR